MPTAVPTAAAPEAPPPPQPLRVAWWPAATRPGLASYRLRCAVLQPALRRWGWATGLYPQVTAPQVLVLGKRYDPASLAQAQDLRRRHGTRLVLDLCDNHLDAETDDPAWAARRAWLLQALDQVDGVVAASDALAEVIRLARPGTAVQVVGDPVEPARRLDGWAALRHPHAAWQATVLGRALPPRGHATRLVWFGQHGTAYARGGLQELARLQPWLEDLQRQRPLHLTVVSNHRARAGALTAGWRLPVHYLDWHPATFDAVLGWQDLALIPVTLTPFTRCKSANRLLTALARGVAVLADPVPSYQPWADLVPLGDWETALARAVAEPGWRQAQVAAARPRLAAEATPEALARQWALALGQVAGFPGVR
ncbi:glycosyltransferase family 4 protein [Ideonella livida]|uniref:Glycosyltransferase family 4 protein n=1 Tax=Ideonella livida TaxID=2707176 RepID=A0A7C9PG42_9BURK|nr:glycosyltransferase family 4 protein [Ideonella livida]NDY90888.1 glycosyltransferase family 4 protein [Ideonella livida]